MKAVDRMPLERRGLLGFASNACKTSVGYWISLRNMLMIIAKT